MAEELGRDTPGPEGGGSGWTGKEEMVRLAEAAPGSPEAQTGPESHLPTPEELHEATLENATIDTYMSPRKTGGGGWQRAGMLRQGLLGPDIDKGSSETSQDYLSYEGIDVVPESTESSDKWVVTYTYRNKLDRPWDMNELGLSYNEPTRSKTNTLTVTVTVSEEWARGLAQAARDNPEAVRECFVAVAQRPEGFQTKTHDNQNLLYPPDNIDIPNFTYKDKDTTDPDLARRQFAAPEGYHMRVTGAWLEGITYDDEPNPGARDLARLQPNRTVISPETPRTRQIQVPAEQAVPAQSEVRTSDSAPDPRDPTPPPISLRPPSSPVASEPLPPPLPPQPEIPSTQQIRVQAEQAVPAPSEMGTPDSVPDPRDPTDAENSAAPAAPGLGTLRPLVEDPFNGKDEPAVTSTGRVGRARERLKVVLGLGQPVGKHRESTQETSTTPGQADVLAAQSGLDRATGASAVPEHNTPAEVVEPEPSAGVGAHRARREHAARQRLRRVWGAARGGVAGMLEQRRQDIEDIKAQRAAAEAAESAAETATGRQVPEEQGMTRLEVQEWLWSGWPDRVFDINTIPELSEGGYTDLALRYRQVEELVAHRPTTPDSVTVSTGYTTRERMALLQRMMRDLHCEPGRSVMIENIHKDARRPAVSFEVMVVEGSPHVGLAVTWAAEGDRRAIKGIHMLAMPEPVFRLSEDGTSRLVLSDAARGYMLNPTTLEVSDPIPTAAGAILRVPEVPPDPVMARAPTIETTQPSATPPPLPGSPPNPGVPASSPPPLPRPDPLAERGAGSRYRSAARVVVESLRGRSRERRIEDAEQRAYALLGMKTSEEAHEKLLQIDPVYNQAYLAEVGSISDTTIRERKQKDFFEAYADKIARQREAMQGALSPEQSLRLKLLSELMVDPDNDQVLQSLVLKLATTAGETGSYLPVEITLPDTKPGPNGELPQWALESVLDLSLAARQSGATPEQKEANPFPVAGEAVVQKPESVEQALNQVSDRWLAQHFVRAVSNGEVDVKNADVVARLGRSVMDRLLPYLSGAGLSSAELLSLGESLAARPDELRDDQKARLEPLVDQFQATFEPLPELDPRSTDKKEIPLELKEQQIPRYRQRLERYIAWGLDNGLLERASGGVTSEWPLGIKPVERANRPRTNMWAPESSAVFQALNVEAGIIERQNLNRTLEAVERRLKAPKTPGEDWVFLRNENDTSGVSLADTAVLDEARSYLIDQGLVELVTETRDDGTQTQVYRVRPDPSNRTMPDARAAKLWGVVTAQEERNRLFAQPKTQSQAQTPPQPQPAAGIELEPLQPEVIEGTVINSPAAEQAETVATQTFKGRFDAIRRMTGDAEISGAMDDLAQDLITGGYAQPGSQPGRALDTVDPANAERLQVVTGYNQLAIDMARKIEELEGTPLRPVEAPAVTPETVTSPAEFTSGNVQDLRRRLEGNNVTPETVDSVLAQVQQWLERGRDDRWLKAQSYGPDTAQIYSMTDRDIPSDRQEAFGELMTLVNDLRAKNARTVEIDPVPLSRSTYYDTTDPYDAQREVDKESARRERDSDNTFSDEHQAADNELAAGLVEVDRSENVSDKIVRLIQLGERAVELGMAEALPDRRLRAVVNPESQAREPYSMSAGFVSEWNELWDAQPKTTPPA